MLRLLLAAALLAAVTQQFLWGLDGPAVTAGYPVNFFSYFTIDSNLVALVALALGGIGLLRGWSPPWLAVLAACAVTYMATTGVVYNALLRHVRAADALGASWPNEVMHLVGPALVVVDWVVWSRGRRLPWRTLWVVAAFPLVWVAYTLVRAQFTGFYPYPFLVPTQPGGWAAVAAYVVGIAVFIIGMGSAAIAVSRMRRRAAPARAGQAEPG